MTPPIICLYSSASQSGKSTAARHLIDYHGFELIKFAEPLYAMLKALFGFVSIAHWPHEMLEARKEEGIPDLRGLTPRYLLRTLGTEWGREYLWPEVWVDLWTNRVKSALADRLRGTRGDAYTIRGIVCDDMRFPNEMVAAKAVGGTTVRIYRDEAGDRRLEHGSEGRLDSLGFDQYIHNDSTIDTLKERVDRLVAKLGEAA